MKKEGTMALTRREIALIKIVKEKIESNEADHLSMEALARFAGITRTTLATNFKAHYGFGLFEYLRMMRMKRAIHLLDHTEIPVNKIAQILGFNHSCNFSRAFKKIEGMSPVKYRKLDDF